MADRGQSPVTPPIPGASAASGIPRSVPDPSTRPAGSSGALRIDQPQQPGSGDSATANWPKSGSTNEPLSSATAQASNPSAHLGQEAMSQAAALKDKATSEASRVGEEAVQAAKETAQRMRQRGAEFANEKKGVAADEVAHLGAALHAAANTLRQRNDRYTGDVTEVAAERVDQMARYLRSRDLKGVVGDLEAYARRQPEWFYGGLFAIGLGAGRFLKASRRSRSLED